MANELAIVAPATTPVSSSTANSPESSDSGDFVAALSEALTAEAASTIATAPLVATALAGDDELEGVEDLIDSSILFVDPQALLLSVEQSKRIDVTAPKSAVTGTATGGDADRITLAALTTAAGLAIENQSASRANAFLDATGQAGRASDTSFDAKGEGKVGGDNAGAAVLAANAAAHERVSELGDRPVIRAHVGTANWTQELAGKLTLMVGRGIQSASLQLSPEHLGPLEIRISVHNEQASVWFGAAHADTRTALEQALPRLREMLAGQGLNLSDAGVFREAPRQQNKQYSGVPGFAADGERDVTFAAAGIRGIVDAYA